MRVVSHHHREAPAIETSEDLPLQMTGQWQFLWRHKRFCFKRKAISESMDSEASQCAPWAMSSIGAI